MNACEFNVPQDRKRVFILGTRNDLNYRLEFPETETISPRDRQQISQNDLFSNRRICCNVEDAILDLPEIDNFEELIEGHEIRYYSKPRSDYAKLMRGEGENKNFFGLPRKNWSIRNVK